MEKTKKNKKKVFGMEKEEKRREDEQVLCTGRGGKRAKESGDERCRQEGASHF